jgi:murein DD-endopeptidase MepM/ murein hydrolase activator NlpD
MGYLMNRVFLCFISSCFLFLSGTGLLYAEENNIYTYIQEYKGRVGQWKNISSQQELISTLDSVGTKYNEFTKINGTNFYYRTYLFIPYSNTYINELKATGGLQMKFSGKEDDLIWPIYSIDKISSSFGIRWGQLHTGIDLPATKGTPVVAVMDGKVISASYVSGHGKSINIEHRNNYYTRYSHNSVMIVQAGEYVKKGQVIAFVGSTGNSTGNHLHFEVRYNDIPLNPLDFLPVKELEVFANFK